MVFKTPERRTGSTETRLHFVADAHAAVRTHRLVDTRQIALWQLHGTPHTLDGLGNHGGHVARRHHVEYLGEVVYTGCRIGIVVEVTEGAA